MTRIAVFADVHGNVPALEAVLADLEAQAPDEVLVGGDLVGRGPQGAAVVRRIAEKGWRSVRGNHEDYLLDFRRGEVPEEWLFTREWSAARWMAAELGEEEAAYIAQLPFSITSRRAPELRLVHGSPRSHNEGIGPWLSDRQIEAHFERVAEPLLVCCHTHRPLLRRFGAGLVVNVGSVGLPFNGDRRAQYALFHRDGGGEGAGGKGAGGKGAGGKGADGEGGGWEVEFRQVEYDVGETLAIYESSGFLAAGGATARLLALELEHAVPFLVPFLKWAEARRIAPEPGRIGEFLDFYDPQAPLGDFFLRLAELEAV